MGKGDLSPSTYLIEFLKRHVAEKYGTHLDLSVAQLRKERVYAKRILKRIAGDSERKINQDDVKDALKYLESRKHLLNCGSLSMASSSYNLSHYLLEKMQTEETKRNRIEDAATFLDYRKLLGD